MKTSLLDLLFPKISLSGKEGEWITDSERRKLVGFPVVESKSQLTNRGLKHLDKLIAGSTYKHSPLLKKAITTLKYGRVRSLADDLVPILLSHVEPQQSAVLCSVPLHWSRLSRRGFNQAGLLARKISDHTGLPKARLLRRMRPTGNQTLKNRAERIESMQRVFRFRGEGIPRHVILVDDVSTTGATLDACAKALKDAGVERVEGWVIAAG